MSDKEEVTEVVEEVKEEIQEEVKADRTQDDVAKAMYEDNEKGEKLPETESEEQSSDEGEEESGEQEETANEEEAEVLTLTLSKDSPLDDGRLTELTEFATEHSLGQKVAQLILEREEAAETSFVARQESDMEALLAEGYKVIEDHPVYGGENLEKAKMVANRPLEKFGDEAVTEALVGKGIINDPSVFDFMHKIGTAMGDDQFVKGEQSKVKKNISTAHKMYPNEAPSN